MNEFLSRDAEASITMQTVLLDTPPLTHSDLSGIFLLCLVFYSDLDPFHVRAKDSVDHISQVEFISPPDSDHVTAFLHGDVIVPLVRIFLFHVSKK